VEVTLEVESRHASRYVLLEDPIPDGMEYLPPGREEAGGYGPVPGYRSDHMEARDDRVAIFATYIPAGRTKICYTLRAGTRGRFLARPARVELMYQPEINAVSKGATLSILP
jgi:uncharacterized protein YfaS (alpha-2-macroglobulin family)